MQFGGPALAIKTVRQFTGVPINHVIVVNFADFKGLIDALGGITVNVPKPILSNRFDCPFATQAACQQWQGWRFPKGPQHMNGQRALIYSRIRENRLDPAETDFTRQPRQQAVMQAVLSKFTSSLDADRAAVRRRLAREADHDRPLDLAADRARLGEVPLLERERAPLPPRRRLRRGGTGAPSEDNPVTIATFLGKSAPQPPTSTFGPGCAVGHEIP